MKTKQTFFTSVKDFLFTHKYESLLVFFVLLYIAYFTAATFLRHDNFLSGRYDLGNMDQVVWNSKHGRIFQSNDDNGAITSRLSFHADFILIPLSALYFVWSNPKTLLFTQTLILASGAIFIYLLGKKILKNKPLALVFSFAYLINPLVEYTNLYDFHAVTLATTFLLAAFYFVQEKKYLPFFLFSFIAALTKEQVWIIVALFGAYIGFFQKKRKLGGLVFFLASGLFYFLVFSAIPQNKGGQHFALSYYQDLGDSPISIIRNTFLSPNKVFDIIRQQDRLGYLVKIFLPLGFTSILAPLILVFALPDIFINTLSANTNLSQIYYHYTAVITPFLFIASIYGVHRLNTRFPKLSLKFFSIYILFSGLLAAYLLGPLPGTRNPSTEMFAKLQIDEVYINGVLKKIPRKATVAATNNIGAHLSHRKVVYTIPAGIEQADYLVFLLGDIFAQPSPDAQKKLVNSLKNNPKYAIVAEKDNFVVFVKKEGS